MSLDAVYRPGSTKPLRRDAGLELVRCEAGRRSRSGRPRSSAGPCVAGIRRLPIGRTTTALPIELSAHATVERSGGATGGGAHTWRSSGAGSAPPCRGRPHPRGGRRRPARHVATAPAQLHTGQRPVAHEQAVRIGAGPCGRQSRSQARAPGCDRSEFASERATRRTSRSAPLAIEAMIATSPLSRSPMRAG